MLVNMRIPWLSFVSLMVGLICCHTATGAPAVKIMCLGDSITEGTTPGGYRSRLCSNLTTAGYDFTFVGSSTTNDSSVLTTADQTHHEGHGGYRISDIENNLDGDSGLSGNNGGYWLSGTTGRAAVYPDLVLLQIGTNDIRPGQSAEAICGRLDSLIGHIFVDRPQATMIVASVTPTNYPESETYDYEAATVAFNALIPDLVAKYVSQARNIYFLDMHSKLNESDIVPTVHPTQAGYDKMGDAWLVAIKAVPEPNAIVLLGTGLFSFGCLLWRRRRGL
jgi:lysophospholipase L1-like esterase